MDEHLKLKSLKLLADPNKLKDYNKSKKTIDKLKHQLELDFKCNLSDKLYNKIKELIKIEIIVYTMLDNIINRAIEHQNLKITEYSLISESV